MCVPESSEPEAPKLLLSYQSMAVQERTTVTVLVHCQQRTRPVTFTRDLTTPDLYLLQAAVRDVFKDVPKLNAPGAVLILQVYSYSRTILGWAELERVW